MISGKKMIIELLLLLIAFSATGVINAQEIISKEQGFLILKSNASKFPKFYRELNFLLDNEVKIKSVKFVRGNRQKSPAFANRREGSITFDLSYIDNPSPSFDDNRFVVILYHELGHLYDNVSGTSAEREEQAFRYSIIKLRQLAEKGDCEPLRTGLKFMRLRSESSNLSDPHTIGLKKIVNTTQFIDSEKYVANGCKEPVETSAEKIFRQNKVESLLKDFRIIRDPVFGSNLYYHINTPKSYKDFLYIYISQRDDGQLLLRLRIQYESGKAIGVRSYLIKASGREIVITPPNSIVRGVKNFSYYSYCDFSVNRYTYKALLDIAASGETEVVYMGAIKSESRMLKDKELDALRKTLLLYELLGGKTDFSD